MRMPEAQLPYISACLTLAICPILPVTRHEDPAHVRGEPSFPELDSLLPVDEAGCEPRVHGHQSDASVTHRPALQST